MWFDWVGDMRLKRSIWLREIQPGLVAVDPSIALWSIVLTIGSTAFVDWWRTRVLLPLIGVVALSSVRYYYSRRHPAEYGHWRWLLVLGLRMFAVVGAGNTMCLLAVPPQSVVGYMKNLLLASGMVVCALLNMWDREMVVLSCPCSLALVSMLCYRANNVCEQGLLVNEYGIQVTRTLFRVMGQGFHLVANLLRPFENDPLLAIPEEHDGAKDVPSCLCLLRTLLVTLSFLLPNSLAYLYERRDLQERMRAIPEDDPHEQNPQGAENEPGGVGPDQGAGFLWQHLHLVVTAGGFTLMAGLWVWAVLRLLHHV